MLGWEFPPFISGGLGVHCFELSRTLASFGAQIDFFMPKTAQPVSSPSSNLKIIQVPQAIGYSTAFGPYNAVSTKEHAKGNALDHVYGPGFFDAVYAYNQACFQCVLQEHSRTPYDLIHAHDWITSLAALKLKHALPLPLIGTIHSTEFDRSAGLNVNPWVSGLEASFVQKSDAIIAVSRMARQKLLRHYAAPAERVFVVYNGVDATRFSNAPPSFKRKGEKLVLFHGRLSIQKGPDFFLKAAKRVLERMPDVRFVVSGTGDMLQQLVQEAAGLGILDRVTFAGYVPEEYLPALYASADAYVLPSVSEPFGITALEAMATGTPAIISHSTGVREALNHALSADFWDADEFANKILAVLSYPALNGVLKEGAKREAALFSWKNTAAQTLSVYDFAIKNKRPS